MSQPTQSVQFAQSAVPEQSENERRRVPLFATANDLPRETRVPMIERLNQSLADTTDLATQLKVAHWNVKGMDFYQLHLLFDEVAETLFEHADALAERATSLGGQANGTVRVAARESSIPELSAQAVTGAEYLEATVDHLAAHAANLRSAIDDAASYGDEDTADLFTELSREVDQQLYFLESHLQTEPVDVLDGGTSGSNGFRGGTDQQGPVPQQSPPQQRGSQRTTFQSQPGTVQGQSRLIQGPPQGTPQSPQGPY